MSYEYRVQLLRSGAGTDDVEAETVWFFDQVVTKDEKQAKQDRSKWCTEHLLSRTIETAGLPLWSLLSALSFVPTDLPTYAGLIQFAFRLTKAYLSKDERVFYLIDNPVRKEWVYQLPYVAPSSWKGSFRAALYKQGREASDPVVHRLLGHPTGDDEDLDAGCLRFFPTFFARQDLEIINPHDRKRRAGENPILMECVPSGTSGVFSLLYLPFDRLGLDDAETRKQIAEDLCLIAEGIHALFCVHGFGAKTSSGYGTAVENLLTGRDARRDGVPEGQIVLNVVPGEPRALQAFCRDFDALDASTRQEWSEMLDEQEFVRYEQAEAARQTHQRYVQAGRMVERIESFGDLKQKLRDWAALLGEEEGDV